MEQWNLNEDPENEPTQIQSTTLTKEQREYNGVKAVFSTNDRTTGYPHTKKKKKREKLDTDLIPLLIKINLKWSKDRSIKHKTIKPLKDKIGETGLSWWYSGHGFGWTPGVGDGQGGLAYCGS